MKILHIDIETAPNVSYTWGLFNQMISIDQIVEPGYTLCFAAKWHKSQKKDVMFHSIWHDGKRGMVEAAAALLGEADAVVHYNGKSFDIPTLCKDFLLELGKPPTPFHQIDLLHVVRKRFRFASNKLDFVARQLGIGKKLPHKGMDLWRGCMHGNPKDQKVMERYNIQDVLLLEKLYERLLPWINKHPNHGLYTDEERPVCTNCGSRHVVKNGVERLATQAYQRYRCQKCGTPLRGRTTILTKEKRAAILTQSKL